jgi:hypothetical protein
VKEGSKARKEEEAKGRTNEPSEYPFPHLKETNTSRAYNKAST